jgi:hypothetical protein
VEQEPVRQQGGAGIDSSQIMALSRRSFLKTTDTALAIPAILRAQGAAPSTQSQETNLTFAFFCGLKIFCAILL